VAIYILLKFFVNFVSILFEQFINMIIICGSVVKALD